MAPIGSAATGVLTVGPMSAAPSSGQPAARRPTRVPLAAAILVLLAARGPAVAAVVIVRPPSSPLRRSPCPHPTFVDDTGTAGVDHTYDGDFDFFVGGGVADVRL